MICLLHKWRTNSSLFILISMDFSTSLLYLVPHYCCNNYTSNHGNKKCKSFGIFCVFHVSLSYLTVTVVLCMSILFYLLYKMRTWESISGKCSAQFSSASLSADPHEKHTAWGLFTKEMGIWERIRRLKSIQFPQVPSRHSSSLPRRCHSTNPLLSLASLWALTEPQSPRCAPVPTQLKFLF